MIPVARTENLLLQDIGNELIIYDQVNNSSHCLTPLAVRVWELSNGQNTVNDIAKKLEKEFNLPADSDVDMRGLVWLTLEELERYSLIQEYLRQPATNVIAGMSRRKVIKTATLVGGFAIGSMFPVVKSVAVANPGGHVSTSAPPEPPCIPEGGKCGTSNPGGGVCCEGLGCNNSSPNGSSNERTCQKRLQI
ncbi:PqqD family protein [Planktothrix sp. FACHB-1365]|uniref:PqqD family protein n=1 Tax=Planktothrix sp. FACHB-1365 TaxID=2692855 RepID=UPI0016880499|nr:PqqD family protein [Planktothrix sp. FACHB-1365]MBD2482469.1 PqqD family protein [Planktothrix sp. FACHB-1365]